MVQQALFTSEVPGVAGADRVARHGGAPASGIVPGWVAPFLVDLARDPDYQRELVEVRAMDARGTSHAALDPPLRPELERALAASGISKLYTHQVEAIGRVRAGEHLVIVSGTASGKSLCYNLPVFESLLDDANATALYLFPTKALAQDQAIAIEALRARSPALQAAVHAGTYDGDTSQYARRKVRDRANLILSNPDMLHQAILPYHTRWTRFLGHLRIVVLDEVHAYRGIFGSHVANVLRRLLRLCEQHGSEPVFVATSATIRNPGELVERLVGRPVRTVDIDGSPRGSKSVAFWNPALVPGDRWQRRPAAIDATRHLVELVRRGVQTIVFTKSRLAAELVLRYATDELRRVDHRLATRVRAYRGGYLPSERREIEAALKSGELLGVVSTNALELGIDIGGLDAAILVGFPPTIASAWQQAGRAGRGRSESLVIVVAHEDPIDQYFMRHPEHFFGASPESAIVDPDNPYVIVGHLSCAAYERPLLSSEAARFGPLAQEVCVLLAEEQRVQSRSERYYWCLPEMPARGVNLRTVSDDNYTILSAAEPGDVIGTVDGISALELVYPEAIYLHEGATFFVRELDLEQKVAFVEPREVDYYTQPVLDHWIRVDDEESQRGLREESRRCAVSTELAEPALFGSAAPAVGERPAEPIAIDADGTRERWNASPPRASSMAGIEDPHLALGRTEVSWQTIAMRKIQFKTRDSIGYHALELPRLRLETRSMWLWIGERLWRALRCGGAQPMEALSGLRNLLVTLVPVYTMCDPTDLGGVIDTSNTARPCIYLFDRYPGGLGFCDQAFLVFEEIVRAAGELARDCPCDDGCPACVGLPMLRPPQQQDTDLHGGWPIPSKGRTLVLIDGLLGELPAA